MERKEIQPAIIAMPSDGLWGDGSAYLPHHKKRFDQWIVEDVPNAVIESVAEADLTSKVCIGGLSMGGFGALMLGSQFSDNFEAISAHSSITKLEDFSKFVEEPVSVYLGEVESTDVVESILKNKDKLPPLRFDCGQSDQLIEGNRLLHKELTNSNVDHIYQEFEGGHEWEYWETHVAKSLLFFDKATSTK
jgi:S-formylglutathione hydrolase FrmB